MDGKMITAPKLMKARIMHKRHTPRVNSFVYKAFYVAVPIVQDYAKFPKSRLLKFNAKGILSFQDADHGAKDHGGRDHGDRDGQSLSGWLFAILKQHDIPTDNMQVVLIAHPRMWGYVFNPVSFWLCYQNSQVIAILAEVNNTFGEAHSYILYKDDLTPITEGDQIKSRKVFHVSPFYHVEGEYKFRFKITDKGFFVALDYYTESLEKTQELQLSTSLAGTYSEVTDANIAKLLLKQPLMTLFVIIKIHWQALKLWRKGITYIRKPSPPLEDVTR